MWFHDLISLTGQARLELHPHQCHLWPHTSQNLLVAAPDTFSPDEGWPTTSVFNLFTHTKGALLNKQWGRCCSTCSMTHIHIHPHLALCPSFFYSVLSRSFYYSDSILSLPVNPTSLVLEAKEQPVRCSLACFQVAADCNRYCAPCN